ncbi:MAG: T9SS type A sorting domain-containing protein [Bacteroidales bacterium]|nr:T9SS type A sorting domain-containing protein [Bacteroidales bacterium]
MKNIRFVWITLLLIAIGIKSFSAIILSENFSDGPSTYTTGNFTFDSGNTWELASITGTSEVKYQLNTSAFIISPAVNTIGTISFKYKEGNSGGGTFVVSKSVDGGAFTTIDSRTFAGSTYSTYSFVVNDLSNNIRIKVSANAGSQLIIDDFQITNYVIGSLLTTSTPALSGFNYIVGNGPSTSKTFNLSGSLLSGDPGNILVTAPANYEISLNNSTFSSAINVAYTSSTLSQTTIYVRLVSGLGIGSYNSANITCAGGGATTISVNLSGSVSPVPPPSLESFPTSLSGFTYVSGLGPSNSQTYNLFGNYLTESPSNIIVTAPTNYEVSLDNSNFSSSLNVPYTSQLLPSTPIYVRLKAGLGIGSYNSAHISNAGGGASSTSVTCNGTVTAIPPDPSLYVSASSLSGFNYIIGSGPSNYQSYNLSGSNLTSYPGNILVAAPGDYEISLSSGSGYATNLSIAYSSASLSPTPIYVRLKSGLSVGNYNSEIIANAGGGATTVNVTCNGSVDDIPPPSLNLSTTILSGFNYVIGTGPSNEQSYTLSGTYLTDFPDNITITAPINYEISLNSGSGYTTSLDIQFSSAILNSTTIYVRLKDGLGIGTYNSELIAHTGGGASPINVICNGNVSNIPPPSLSASPTSLNGLNYTIGSGPSAAQSYNLSGSYLTGYPDNITISAPVDYEISLSSGSGYATSILVPYSTATLTSTPIYVRLKSDLSVGTYNSEYITNSGGGAIDVDVTCNGTVSDISTDPCLSEDFSGFTDGSHASPGSTDVSSSLNTYTQTTGWDGYKIFSAGGEIKLGSSSAAGYIITPTVDLSAGGTVEFDYAKYGSDNSSMQIFHAADGVNFSQVGSNSTPITDFQTHSVEITDGTASSKIKIGSSTKRIYVDNIEIYCGGLAPTPELTANPTSLTGFYYTYGSGPSNEQSFVISGSDLDGTNVIVTPPANYQISEIPTGGFQSSAIVLSAFNGADRSIYVRLKEGLDAGTYNSDLITISGGAADNVTVSLNGYVEVELIPVLTANPTSLTGFYYTYGSGPSYEQSFVISGSDLDGTNVIVTPPANYQISEIPTGGFQSSAITLSAYNGADRSIFVRLKEGLDVGTYNSDIITISGGGADNVTVSLNGYVEAELMPVLVANPEILEGFNYIFGYGSSAEQSFILSGNDLDNSQLTITPPLDYQISLTSGTGFQSIPIIFNSFGGNETTFFVRLKADLAVGDYNNEQILISGSGADDVIVTCNGTVDEYVNAELANIKENINIYPNPVTDILNISIGNWKAEKINWEIVNITGQKVLNGVIYSNDSFASEQIDISDFNPGMYVIRFSDNNKMFVRKIDKK